MAADHRPTTPASVNRHQYSSLFTFTLSLSLSLSLSVGMGNRAINLRTTQPGSSRERQTDRQSRSLPPDARRPSLGPSCSVGRRGRRRGASSPLFPQFSIAAGAEVTSCRVKNHRRRRSKKKERREREERERGSGKTFLFTAVRLPSNSADRRASLLPFVLPAFAPILQSARGYEVGRQVSASEA